MKKAITVVVTTAQKLDEAQKKTIISALNKKLGKVELQEVIDKEVIGGLKIKVGTQEFDVSTSGKLNAIESQIPQVTAVTAVPLTTDQRKQVKAIIQDRVGSAELNEVVDPNVIGGIKLMFNSEEYDGTIQGKIDQLKASVLRNI